MVSEMKNTLTFQTLSLTESYHLHQNTKMIHPHPCLK